MEIDVSFMSSRTKKFSYLINISLCGQKKIKLGTSFGPDFMISLYHHLHPTSYVKVLTLNVAITGDGAFNEIIKVKWGYKGGALIL